MTYTYECKSCHHEWEVDQKITEIPIKICPECDKPTAVRTISNTLFILKGDGWAKDGYQG